MLSMDVRLTVSPTVGQLWGGDAALNLVAFGFNKIKRMRLWFKFVLFNRKEKIYTLQVFFLRTRYMRIQYICVCVACVLHWF